MTHVKNWVNGISESSFGSTFATVLAAVDDLETHYALDPKYEGAAIMRFNDLFRCATTKASFCR